MHTSQHRTHRLLTPQLTPQLTSQLTPQRTTLLKRLVPAAAMALAMVAATPAHATSDGGLTRAEVREALNTWRAAGLMSTQTEVGDTPDVLQRREEFYALQTEVTLARYRAEAEALAAADAAAQAQALAQLQMQQGEPGMQESANAGEALVSGEGTGLVIVELDD